MFIKYTLLWEEGELKVTCVKKNMAGAAYTVRSKNPLLLKRNMS